MGTTEQEQPNKDHLSMMCVSVTQKEELWIILPVSRKGKTKSSKPVRKSFPILFAHRGLLSSHRFVLWKVIKPNKVRVETDSEHRGRGVKFKWQVVPKVVPLQCSAGSLADFARYDRVQRASGVWVNRHRELEFLGYMGRCVVCSDKTAASSGAPRFYNVHQSSDNILRLWDKSITVITVISLDSRGLQWKMWNSIILSTEFLTLYPTVSKETIDYIL